MVGSIVPKGQGIIVLRVIRVLFRLRGLSGKPCIAVVSCIAALLGIPGISRGLWTFVENTLLPVDMLSVGEKAKISFFAIFFLTIRPFERMSS